MLELKNVSKIYQTRGGKVRALDNISITFPEMGLVFLLGKSGSGKSTLLNVAGGLDAPTEGEIVVLGKSSKTFTESDFDSYRNTYVGFIFQEYNVLDEFTVEENVALAMELQGKTKNQDKIASILQKVELSVYAKRRPNTLSGGQKQRVAIARALVKDPKIIMADEPTGALDSSTGKQVFDTLKHLSQERLVIVVSHDREFAEEYGDRIIELKDGKIISDVSKVCSAPVSDDENISEIDGDTLFIGSGKALSAEAVTKIQSFICESDEEIVISKGKRKIISFRRANSISKNGRRKHFEETPPAEKKSVADTALFITSRLPMSKALKIGTSSLRVKPFRLVFTILLSLIALIAFGLLSTVMLYDEDSVMSKSFMESDYEYLTISKRYHTTVSYTISGEENSYESSGAALFTQEEIQSFGGNNAFGAFEWNASAENISVTGSRYYSSSIRKAALIPEGHIMRSEIIAGQYPQALNEICVSSYFYESVQNGNYYQVGENGEVSEMSERIDNVQSLIGKTVILYRESYKICGVFNSGHIPSKFEEVKNSGASSNLYSQFRTYIQEGLQSCVFVSEQLAERFAENVISSNYMGGYFDTSATGYYFTASEDFDYVEAYESGEWFEYVQYFNTYKNAQPRYDVVWLNDGELSENEVVVPLSFLTDRIYVLMQTQADDTELARLYEMLGAIGSTGSEETVPSVTEILSGRDDVTDGYLCMPSYNADTGNTYDCVGAFKIVGFYLNNDNGVYCSQEFYESLDVTDTAQKVTTKYKYEDNALFEHGFIPMPNSESALREVFDRLNTVNANTDVFYTQENSLYDTVLAVSDVMDLLSTVLLVIGLLFMVFAALLLLNFITISIGRKKKEIGILRAIGARGVDVFKIFFCESGVIVGICLILSVVGTLIAAAALNYVLKAQMGLAVAIFVFGPLPILLMIAVAIIVAFLGTFFPVFFAARKKPVDTIRAL